MKYISLIDELGIDVNTIATLDATKVIRLQKQLKANAVLNNKSNLGELASLIDELKNESTRNHHVFIENHKWLKQIITGDYTNVLQTSVEINEDEITDLESLRYFLNPYLKEHIRPFLSEVLSKGKYNLLINTVESNVLFTEEIEQIIISFFSSRLNYAKVYIEEGKLNDAHYPVAFLTNRNFIKCLSQYPSSFDEEVNELNSIVIDAYNSKRKNVNNSIFIFTARIMVAFGELDISNYMLKDVLTSNAKITKSYATNTSSKSKSGSGAGIWSVLVIAFIIIRLAALGYRSINTSSSSGPDFNFEQFEINNPDFENENLQEILRAIKERQEAEKNGTSLTDNDEEEVEETVIESNESSIEYNEDYSKATLKSNTDKYKQKDHTRFIYTLKLKTKRGEENLGSASSTDLQAFTNPYPKTFNLIEAYTSGVNNITEFSLIKNNSKRDLIVFKLTEGVNQSIYIPKERKINIKLKTGDSLLFYTGNNFIVDRFSHFESKMELSQLYLVSELSGNLGQEINIFPQKITTYKKSKVNSNIKTKDTSKIDVIKTRHVKLKNISIDRLYTNWYRKKYN